MNACKIASMPATDLVLCKDSVTARLTPACAAACIKQRQAKGCCPSHSSRVGTQLHRERGTCDHRDHQGPGLKRMVTCHPISYFATMIVCQFIALDLVRIRAKRLCRPCVKISAWVGRAFTKRHFIAQHACKQNQRAAIHGSTSSIVLRLGNQVIQGSCYIQNIPSEPQAIRPQTFIASLLCTLAGRCYVSAI
jgi:hypothetical protein